MSPHTNMDELFDLDMALTTTVEYDAANGHHSVDARATAIHEMPTVAAEGGGGECIVCMEELGVGGAVKKVPCAHVFHENCISKWLSLHDSCPLCRRRVLPT